MAYERNSYFQYLKRNFTGEDIKRIFRRSRKSVQNKKDEKIITNGDRIRSMTDEELADFMATDAVIACMHCNDNMQICSAESGCKRPHEVNVFLSWLQEEWQPEGESYV